MKDAGLMTAANWDEKIQANNAGTVATQMYGGWYEGTIRSTAPDLAGKWGVYQMPQPDRRRPARRQSRRLVARHHRRPRRTRKRPGPI